MGGSSHPGEVIVFKVKGVHGNDVLIEIKTGDPSYLVEGTVYVAKVTPKSE